MKNSLLWGSIAIVLLFFFTLAFPIFWFCSLKAVYLIGGGLLITYVTYLAFKKVDSFFFFFDAEKRKNAYQLTKFKKFSLTFLMIVYLGLIGGLCSFRMYSALEKEGKIAKAIVLGGVNTKRDYVLKADESTFTLDFLFSTQKGEVVRGSERVNANEYRSKFIGSRVKVVYLPAHPVVHLLLLDESEVKFYAK